ncbi:MAG: hypothetical protein EBY16_02935 [Gammaproteobacteria bacterium]|nr:hypothetical protein [Gammaproteobacteria bacterium]
MNNISSIEIPQQQDIASDIVLQRLINDNPSNLLSIKTRPFLFSKQTIPSFFYEHQDFVDLFNKFADTISQTIQDKTVFQDTKNKIAEDLWIVMCAAIILDRKTIYSQDVATIIFSKTLGISNESLQLIYDLVCNTYAMIDFLCFSNQPIIKFEKLHNHPSILHGKQINRAHNSLIHTSSMNNYGQGSYDLNGNWQFGNQRLPSIINQNAQFGHNLVHPSYGIKFSFILDESKKFYILYIDNPAQGISMHLDGAIKTEDLKWISEYFTDITFKKMSNNEELWIEYEDKTRKHKSIYISFSPEKDKNFFVRCLAAKYAYGRHVTWYAEIIDPNNQKIAEYSFSDSGNEEDVEKHKAFLSQKIGEYVASEIIAYAFACVHGRRIPHAAIVPPDGNPWSALRVSGSVSSIPPFMTGQAAFSGSTLQPVVKAADMELSRDGGINDLFPLDKHVPPLLHLYSWSDFQKQTVCVFTSEHSVNISFSPEHYYMNVKYYMLHQILVATLHSASGDFIDEAAFRGSTILDLPKIAKIILAKTLKVVGAPRIDQIGLEICKKPITFDLDRSKYATPSVGGEDNNNIDLKSLQNSWESININSSSLVLTKFSNPSNVYGNLTEKISWFDKKTVENTQESKIKISNIEEFCKRCVSYFKSQYISEKISDKESMQNVISSEQISSAVLSIADRNHSKNYIPRLSRINNIGMKSDDKNRESFVFCQVMHQPHSLSYVVVLKGEHWPQVENSFTKEYVEIDPGSGRDDYLRLFEFEIICVDSAGNPMVKYCPNYQIGQVSVPRCANIEEIVCGYLPDFICWMSSQGIHLHRISSNSIRFSHITLSPENISSLIFNSSLIYSNINPIKTWLLSYFPSLHDMNQNPAHDSVSVLEHLLNSTILVDLPRDDGYCPASEIASGYDLACLRAALLLHDIGKAAPQDGGVGGYSTDHIKKSVSMAWPIIQQLSLMDHQKELALFLIHNQDIIAKAHSGEIGAIDRAIAHIGKICGDEKTAELLYHMHRCDTDSAFIFQEQSSYESIKIHDKTNMTSRQLIDRVKSYINSSLFAKTDKSLIIPTTQYSKNIHFHNIFQSNSKKTSNGEKVLQTIHLSNINKIYQKEYQSLTYNPEYWNNAPMLYDEAASSPELSFAKAFGMSYDGPTGTIVRGFYWTSPEYVEYLSQNGICAYDKSNKFSISAMINFPDINEISKLKKFPQDVLLVFDYHVGKFLTEDELSYLGKIWRSWNILKYGQQLFSLNYNGEQDEANPQIALDFGYSSVLSNKTDPDDAAVMSIICFDPSRIGLIGAYEYKKSNDKYQKNTATITPMHLPLALPGGKTQYILSPHISQDEIFLDNKHKLHVCQKNRILFAKKLWNDMPNSIYMEQ